MHEKEKHLSDEVFPVETTRQWVLSLPIPVRMVCSRDRKIINLLVKAFYSAVGTLIKRKLKSLDKVTKSDGGGVLFIQRLGGALNLNIHFHAIFLDGAYTNGENGGYQFHDLCDRLTNEDVAWTVRRVAKRSVKILQRHGYLDSEFNLAGTDDANGIELCDGASIKSRIAFGPRAGKEVRRIRLNLGESQPRVLGALNAEMHGFNLKADRVIKAHQRWKLNRLIRYVARPPVALDRLRFDSGSSTVTYSMKRPWSDGTTEVILSGTEFVEKMAAAVPPPRGHLVRYIGVFAPNSPIRDHIALKTKPPSRCKSGVKDPTYNQRTAWAELMKRAFGYELSECEHCGGKIRRIAVITDQATIRKILQHVRRGDPLDVLVEQAPRPPPKLELVTDEI